MATRQYIGARYVPKFYQNSVDGSAQWESNVVYEPLTFVTLTNSHMYISKKQVPATIGSPVSNIEYWLDVGSYNGFIEQLQDEIDNINDVTIPALQDAIALKQSITDNTLTTTSKTIVGAINELDSDVALKQDITDNNLTTTAKTIVGAINELVTNEQGLSNKIDDVKAKDVTSNRHVVILADSYGDESSEYPMLIKNMGVFKQVDIVAGGGWGFTGKEGAESGQTGVTLEWLTHFTSFVNGLTDAQKEDITDVYIVGGFNDQYSTAAIIDTHMSAFFAYANNALPNAKYHVGFCAWANNGSVTTPNMTSTGAAIRLTLSTTVLTAYQKCVKYGAEFMGTFIKPLHNYSTAFDYTNYHPSATAQVEIAEELVSAMLGVKIANSTTFSQGITINNVDTIIGALRYEGDTIHFMSNDTLVAATPSANVASGNICTFSDLSLSAVNNHIFGNRTAHVRQGIECLVRVRGAGNPYYKGILFYDVDGAFKMLLPFACTSTDTIDMLPQNSTISILDC